MAHYNPHWYIVERDHRGEVGDAFVAFVRVGADPQVQGGRYHCVTVDGFDYWLTHGGEDGWIVNRKSTAEAGSDSEPPPTRDPRELIWHDVERELISRGQPKSFCAASAARGSENRGRRRVGVSK